MVSHGSRNVWQTYSFHGEAGDREMGPEQSEAFKGLPPVVHQLGPMPQKFHNPKQHHCLDVKYPNM